MIAPSGDNRKGINQYERPDPPYALISVVSCRTVDGRLRAVTRLGEEVNLKNRSRGEHKQSNIGEFLLPVQEPFSEEHVGDVFLCVFGDKITFQLKYEAICAGILLHSSSHQSEDISEWMSPGGKYF